MVSSQRVFHFSLERTQLNNFIKRTLLLAKSHNFYVEPAGCHTQLTALILIHLGLVLPLGFLILMMQQRWLYQSCFYSCHCARTHALAPMWAAAVCDCVPLTTVRSLAGICIRQQPVFDSMESGHVQFLLILWFPFEKREREREREGEDLNEQFFVVYLYTSPSSWEFLSPVDILSFFFLSYRCIFAAYTFLWEEEKKSLPFS